MSVTVPLIRGFALLPTLRFVADKGVSVADALHQANLPADLISDPFRPIPLLDVAALLRDAARGYGPDLPCRILSEASNIEIAMLGKVTLGGKTPREALGRIITALPYYCSHEQVSMQRGSGGTIIREFFSCRLEPETRHLLLQYAASMIDKVLGMTGAPSPRFSRLELPPHPDFGLEHLHRWFGPGLVETKSRGLTAEVDDETMDRPFRKAARDRLNPRLLQEMVPLQGDGSLVGSVASLLVSMIHSDQKPDMKRVIAAAGLSARTFQRQLAAEGTNFRQLLAEVRRDEGLKRLSQSGHTTIATIAADLGYADQASLTRAFRRWTGQSPSKFRANIT